MKVPVELNLEQPTNSGDIEKLEFTVKTLRTRLNELSNRMTGQERFSNIADDVLTSKIDRLEDLLEKKITVIHRWNIALTLTAVVLFVCFIVGLR